MANIDIGNGARLNGNQNSFDRLIGNQKFHVLLATLPQLIQTMKVFPSQSLQFDLLLTSIIAIFAWAMASEAEIRLQGHENRTYHKIAGNVRIMAGVIATASLVLVVTTKFGWILCVTWALFNIWGAYHTYGQFYHDLFGRLQEFLNSACNSALNVARMITNGAPEN